MTNVLTRRGPGDRVLPWSTPVAFYDDPGEVPTPRAFSDRDGYLPALRLEVVPQGCRQRRRYVPGEHPIVFLRSERNEVTIRRLLIHLQHVGTMGDFLETRQHMSGLAFDDAALISRTLRRSQRLATLGREKSGLRPRNALWEPGRALD
jgi:hypothetical protein